MIKPLGSVLSFACLMGPVLAPQTAHSVDSAFVEPEVRYRKAVTDIHRAGLLVSGPITPSVFARFDWVGKTALINLACPIGAGDVASIPCSSVLAIGIDDQALVVRDHAFRMILGHKSISADAKQQFARKVVSDPRNYRRGRALWIVPNAERFLVKAAIDE